MWMEEEKEQFYLHVDKEAVGLLSTYSIQLHPLKEATELSRTITLLKAEFRNEAHSHSLAVYTFVTSHHLC